MKIKKIMVSQPKPELERSPYFELARNFGIEIDFRPFIQIEPIPSREFRKSRIDILSYGAVILTSKNAVDHYFRMCNELRIIVPETMKYFCISEATAYYLQKYIQFRKRKIFSGNYSFADLVEIIKKKHKEEKFLLPCAIDSSEEYTELLDKEGIRYVKAPMYKAIYSTLTDINFTQYDLVVLFSSAGVSSLLHSHPTFRENKIKLAAFGEQTAEAILEAGLDLHIHAPQPYAPSMAMALEQYLKGEQSNHPWQQVPFGSKPAAAKEEKKTVSKPREKNVVGKSLPGKTNPKASQEKAPGAKKTAPVQKHEKKPVAVPKQTKSAVSKGKPTPQKSLPGKQVKNNQGKADPNRNLNKGKQPSQRAVKSSIPAKKVRIAAKKSKAPVKRTAKGKKTGVTGKNARVAAKRKR